MRKIALSGVMALFFLANTVVTAQNTIDLSLEQAIDYALEHNYTVINSTTDIDISKRQVNAMTAIGLPQINATVDYNNFLELPTSLIPGEFFDPELAGEFIPVQFGTKQNVTADATLTQLIFNGSYIVGLQAARAVVEISNSELKKDKIELKEGVSNAYYGVLVVEETLSIIDSTLATLQKMLFEVRETYKIGFVEETDVDQLELLVADLEAAKMQVTNQLEITKNFLKFQIGMEISQPINLTEGLEELYFKMDQNLLLNSTFDYTQHIDYKLLQDQEVLKQFNLKNKKAQYLPSLMGYLNYSQNAQRSEFNFFNKEEEWFNTTVLGVNLSIPIWSSGQRNNEVQQAKLELEKIRVLGDQVKEGLSMEYTTALSNYKNALEVFKNKQKSVTTAEKIYNKTIIKYEEGVSSSMDLLQSYNQYLDAESSYISALMDLFSSMTALDKVLTKY